MIMNITSSSNLIILLEDIPNGITFQLQIPEKIEYYSFSFCNEKEYRFNIINMMKPDSLYNCGMKPLIYSEAAARYKSMSLT